LECKNEGFKHYLLTDYLFFSHFRSDSWPLEWSELSMSYSFSFSYASTNHHPTAPTPNHHPTTSKTSPSTNNSNPSKYSDTPSFAPSRHSNAPSPSSPISRSDNPSSAPTNGLIPIGRPETSSPTQPLSLATINPKATISPSFKPFKAPHGAWPASHSPARPSSKGTLNPTHVRNSSTVPSGSVSTTAIFECTTNGIAALPANDVSKPTIRQTTIQISVTYFVESLNGTLFLDNLPEALLKTAVNASLNCQGGAARRRLGGGGGETGTYRHLVMSTTILGTNDDFMSSIFFYGFVW
jgi:hypothetical protein